MGLYFIYKARTVLSLTLTVIRLAAIMECFLPIFSLNNFSLVNSYNVFKIISKFILKF